MTISAAPLIALVLAFEWPGAFDADARDLGSPDDAARLRAVERLALRDLPRAKPLLLPALADRDPGIRLTAARAMARAGVPQAIDAATEWILTPGGRDRPLGLLVLRDAGAFPGAARRATERALGDSDADIRIKALDVLEHHELGSSFGAVVAAVDDDHREVRLRAIRILGGARDGRAAVPLLARLADSDRQVRLETLRALGTLGDPHVAPALLRLLSDPSDDVRVAAIDALAGLKLATTAPTLAALARRRPADDLARHAQLALGAIASPDAVAALVAMTRDPPFGEELKEAFRRAGGAATAPLVRELAVGTPTSAAFAAWALGEIGDRRATPALAAAADHAGGGAAAALAALAALADPTAVPALVRAASASTADLRRLALDALTATGDDRAIVLYPRVLGDPDAGVRARAIRLAAALDARAMAPEIARRLTDPEAEVRVEAALALAVVAGAGGGAGTADGSARGGTVGRPSAGPVTAPGVAPGTAPVVAPILAALGTPPFDRGGAAAEALGDALERAVRAADAASLAQAALTIKGDARAAVARGLAAAHAERPLDDPALVDRLIALVDEGGAVALAAADALGAARLPAGREAALLRAFGDAEAAVQARLCPALASFETGVVRLGALLDDREAPDEVRAAAAWASAGGAGARAALERAAADPAPGVAANARAALALAGKRAPGAWVAVRLTAPDGRTWPSRWLAVRTGDGTEIWAMTDGTGRARVGALPPGPYELRAVDPALATLPAAAPAPRATALRAALPLRD